MKRLAKIAGVAAGLGAGLLVASCSSGADDADSAQGASAQTEQSQLEADQPTLTEVAQAQQEQVQQPEQAEAAPTKKRPNPRTAPPPRPKGKVDFASFLEEVKPGDFDPLSLAVADGIVWYGTWEAAMAEYERTGKPVMLHFGSPRCPDNEVCVPGTW